MKQRKIRTVVVGSKGQLTVPVALRRFLKLKPGDQLEIVPSGEAEFRATVKGRTKAKRV